MADIAVTAADVRAVKHDPEDVYTVDAGSGYTPAKGDLVGISGSDAVLPTDATDADAGPVEALGVVIGYRRYMSNAGVATYKVDVLTKGLVEGFAGMTPGARCFNSVTVGRISDADPTDTGITGRVVGQALTATAILFNCPGQTP